MTERDRDRDRERERERERETERERERESRCYLEAVQVDTLLTFEVEYICGHLVLGWAGSVPLSVV